MNAGFESDTDKRKDCIPLLLQQAGYPNHPSMAMMPPYWADDHSLWNPNIITPDPLMETQAANSFSITYLQDSSRETEYEMQQQQQQHSSESPSDVSHHVMPNPGIDLSLSSVEPAIPAADDDVFF